VQFTGPSLNSKPLRVNMQSLLSLIDPLLQPTFIIITHTPCIYVNTLHESACAHSKGKLSKFFQLLDLCVLSKITRHHRHQSN